MSSKHIDKKKAAASVLVASAVITTGVQANRLAADPDGPKDCPPVYAASQAPQTQIDVQINPLPKSELLKWKQRGGTINDVSCLNRTPVYGIVQISTEDDIRNALEFARENKLKVSMAAVRHSMGGQAFYRDNLVLDMLSYNKMSLDEESMTLTVQSGATWHDIQSFLHPKYAVKAMQSSDIFSVGGSISVNAHGMDHLAGSVGSSIRSMRVMLADGTVARLSPEENPELFNLVVGGYGLFGVILDVDLQIVENSIYETERATTTYAEFPKLFETDILPDQNLGLFYGHLSTAPSSLLDEMFLYKYVKVNAGDAEVPPLGEVSSTKLRRFVLNFSKLGKLPMEIKWFAEKYIEPKMESCTVVPRTQAMAEGEACLVSRNEPMHDSVKYLQNNLKKETDILHEYFIPRDQFIPFVDGLRNVVRDHNVNLLNASVRVIHPEGNFLTYAPEEMYSIVLYINQSVDEAGNEKMIAVTRELIDLTTSLGGRFFLPYQLHYTPEQLRASYPQIGDFFKAKASYDPQGLFTNTWYEKYSGAFR